MGKTSGGSIHFDRGIVRDKSRDQLPRGAAHDLIDYIIQLGSPERGRGGWTMGSKDLNSLSSAARINALGWAPFPTSPHLVMIANTGTVFKSTDPIDSGSGALVSTGSVVPTCRPFWHRDRMILLPGLDQGTLTPRKYYDAGGGAFTVADIGGTPPSARVGASWGDYLLLANTPTNKNRIYVSAVGNPDSYNLTTGLFDVRDEVVGVVNTRGQILVFEYDKVESITGELPPPGGNWTRRDLFATGCMDGRSLAQYREYIIWANSSGVWRTDGVTLTDLTEEGGISTYYQDLVSGFNFGTGWKAAGGVYRGHYFLTITNAAGANVVTFICDLDSFVWFRASNIKTYMYAQRQSTAGTATESGDEELFAAWASGPRAIRISPLWEKTAANASDGDGVAVQGEIETPYYKLDTTGQKRVRNVYVGYDLVSAGANPYLQVGYVLEPEATAYINASPTLQAAGKFVRRPVRIGKKGQGAAFKIAQVGASADTRIHEFEIEGHKLEESR